MELFRLHAYTVSPQRTVAEGPGPIGGTVTITAGLREVLETSVAAARLGERTLVDFDMPDGARENEMRTLFISYGFGADVPSSRAASTIATKLGAAMDMRSAPCLLVLTAMQEDDRRRVTVWTFPRDQALRLRGGAAGAGARIQILADIFSRTSKLRKAAMFEGRNLRNEFLQGRALDFQADKLAQDVADFWIHRFLQCKLSIAADAGTRMLASTVRKAVDACSEVRDQEQLLTAVMAIRTAPQRRWSLNTFAEQYLQGTAREQFLLAAPNAESRTTMFDFSRPEFERVLAYRVFTLASGVLVSSPLDEIGRSVVVQGEEDRQLSCEGAVVGEKVRTRHA